MTLNAATAIPDGKSELLLFSSFSKTASLRYLLDHIRERDHGAPL